MNVSKEQLMVGFHTLVIKRFVKFLIVGDNSGEKVVAHFTNTASFQSFLVAMEIAKDYEQLDADKYFSQTSRKWATSLISPFAANLAAILYE